MERDFAPIALMFTFPFLLVANPSLGVKTLKELVDYAKARPGSSTGARRRVGTGGHLVTELLLKRTGIEGQHVPYPGTDAATDRRPPKAPCSSPSIRPAMHAGSFDAGKVFRSASPA